MRAEYLTIVWNILLAQFGVYPTILSLIPISRVAFDCAAQYNGKSLNSELLQGPDLTNNLVGVLTRFRKELVALMADVKSMFHQVQVSPKDCHAFRFLWWPRNDLDSDPAEYQMLVHLFGASSSPGCSDFALRRTADDNRAEFRQEVVDTIKRNYKCGRLSFKSLSEVRPRPYHW